MLFVEVPGAGGRKLSQEDKKMDRMVRFEYVMKFD